MRLWGLLLARLDGLDRGVTFELPGDDDCLFDAHSSESESSQGSIVGAVVALVVGRAVGNFHKHVRY